MHLPDRLHTTDEQKELAELIEELLDTAGAVFRRVERGGAEPWYRILIDPTCDGKLTVSIDIAPDMFAMDANGASLRLARLDSPDGATWIETCLGTLTRLANDDLTVRLRRTLFGRTVGAVRIPSDDGNHVWNGELLACRGMGKVHSFPRWLQA